MCTKSMIFVILFLCCELISVQSLKAGAPNVCVVKSSARKTRSKPIQVAINKWCGKKKCVVRRTKLETYIAWRTQLVCCGGWQYRSKDDSCAPLCSTGCNGGRCIAPDRCTCDPPAIIHPEHKNTCIIPDCNPPCINSQCINNTCICHQNYTQFNTTHCYRCDSGYVLDDNFTCIKCQCDHGTCINGTCICDEGYALKANVCEPICNTCNGKCIAPNVCQCSEGYANVGGKCEPQCNCEKCVAPNVCECADGYRTVNGSCELICDDCADGHCSAPNVCSCNEGFVKNSDGVCRKCSETCSNCDDNGVCLEDTCKGFGRRFSCCPGFVYDRINKTCRPKCVNGCKNGNCVTPNNCVCTPPLVLHNGNECVNPTCDMPCTNGICTARNTCVCQTGYVPVDNFTCEPVCDPPCLHGKCVAPNKCDCSLGYHSINETVCEPVCNDCDNGLCVAPNTCKCHTGYKMTNGVCTPDCERPCLNGICFEPDKCLCNAGYEIDPLDRFTCRPICKIPCVNASCSSPNACTCLPGYFSLNETVCAPKCDDCSHGDCVAPNECRCRNGYTLDGGMCVPQCDNCTNGICTAPNNCICNRGYERRGGLCEPVCDPRCINGSCVAPNQCKCFEGFRPKDPVTCVADCDNCKNGRCMPGNVCFCNFGYSMVDGTCTPSCSLPCVNGKCVAPNTCECDDGYTRNQTVPTTCFKNCTCSNGKCIDGECICDLGFELLDDVCIEIKPVECSSCEGNCTDGVCWCKGGRPCFHVEEPAEVGAPTRLAGLELSWLLGGVVGIALLTLVIVVMGHIWRKRREYGVKTNNTGGNEIGSVVYTVPDTLLQRRIGSTVNVYGDYETDDEEHEPSANEPLKPTVIDDKL